MQFSQKQAEAIQAATRWLRTGGKGVFRVFGYAGTGKTTVAREIADAAVDGTDKRILYAAYTGKAASVMRSCGCSGASTIHSLIYKVVEDDYGKVTFVLNPDSSLRGAGLLVVDEVSMVGREIGLDILSFGCPVLVMGDPAQLPPVAGGGYFTQAKPDVMLDEIFRQKDDGIVRLAEKVRQGQTLLQAKAGERDGKGDLVYSGVMRKDKDIAVSEAAKDLDDGQILCGTNATRRRLNDAVREKLGMPIHAPVVGDKLVCLRNDHQKGILNGTTWRVQKCDKKGSRYKLSVSPYDEDAADEVEVSVPEAFFAGAEDKLDWKKKKGCEEFTFGYAMTVHKSQGSQYKRIYLVDESRFFKEHSANHAYTAVTRAVSELLILS
jgi:exodeoxyribonuclease-5